MILIIENQLKFNEMDMPYKCINKTGWEQRRGNIFVQLFFGRNKDAAGPKFGEIVTVIGEYYDEEIKCFHLLEWPSRHERDGFQADCFVPFYPDEETEWAVEETKKITSQPIVINQ